MKQAQSINDTPPPFITPLTLPGRNFVRSPRRRNTQIAFGFFPFSTDTSSDQTILAQSSTVQSECTRAQANLIPAVLSVSFAQFAARHFRILSFRNRRRIERRERVEPVSSLICMCLKCVLASATVLSSRSSASVDFRGPPGCGKFL